VPVLPFCAISTAHNRSKEAFIRLAAPVYRDAIHAARISHNTAPTTTSQPAPQAPAQPGLDVASIFALQRVAGNAAVTKLLERSRMSRHASSACPLPPSPSIPLSLQLQAKTPVLGEMVVQRHAFPQGPRLFGYPTVMIPSGPPAGGEEAMARFEQLVRTSLTQDPGPLTRATLGEAAAFPGDVGAKAQLFNAMATRISQARRGNWIALPTNGSGGSVVFVGKAAGETLGGYAAHISEAGVTTGGYTQGTFTVSETKAPLPSLRQR
jgi:hypothetical protein